MSYREKLDLAQNIINQYNAKIQDASKHLDFQSFLDRLQAEGGTTEEALSYCSFEDIEEYGSSSTTKFPKLLAKQVAGLFRKKERDKVVTEKKARVMNLRELLESYNPKEFDAVAVRLVELSKRPVGGLERSFWPQYPCIVFNEDGSVNADASLSVLEDLKEGLDPLDVFIGNDGVPQKLYKINELPDNAVHENPLLPGRPLRGVAETCDKTHRSWTNIPYKVRVLLRLALVSGELVIEQITRIHDTLDLLVGKSESEMITLVSKRFHQAALLYKEKELEGTLPTLKLVRNGTSKELKKQDPFHRSHKQF